MTLRTATRRAFLYPAATAAATDWWLSGGISAANAIAVYQPKGAASLAASYTNLANPGTYDAAPGTAPTFATETGWTFIGSRYLVSGVVPQNGWTVAARFANVTNDGYVFGYNDTINRFYFRPNRALGVFWGYGDAFDYGTETGVTSGVGILAANTAYLDGVNENVTLGTHSGSLSTSFALGAQDYQNGSQIPDLPIAGDILAVAIYDTQLSSGQAAALSAAMAAL